MTDSNEKILNDLLKDRFDGKTKSEGCDEIVCIVDRSGSMHRLRADAQGGINTFIEEQRKVGDANLTIIEFDNEVNTVCDQVNINEATEYSLIPRGGTALLDAIGMVISEKEKYKAENGKTIVVVITDGKENASVEWTRDNIFSLMKEREEDGWEFLFLAAGQNAIAVGQSYGFSSEKTISFACTGKGMQDANEVMGLYTSTVRRATSADAVALKSAYINTKLDTLSEVGKVGAEVTLKDEKDIV